jgi:hypothetical protein
MSAAESFCRSLFVVYNREHVKAADDIEVGLADLDPVPRFADL